jgi:alkane 1-monooxygenase
MAGFVLPPHVALCMQAGGWWTFLPVATVFCAVPILDELAGMADQVRPSPDVDRNVWFRLVTWAWVPVQLTLLAWVLMVAASGRLSTLELIGATVSMGITAGGFGITFAHELVHRRGRFERALGEIVLASVSYTHFAIEHVHGHHRHVGTPLDPATARFGESFYRFLPRTLAGSLASAWRLEVERLARRGRSTWSPANRMLRYGLTQVLLYGGLAAVYGPTGVAVFAGQAVVAFSLLEVINYIEHYGLTRREIAPGEYERIAPHHSWDSSYRVSNWMLINLARHADHHCVASKRYQSLELPAPAPQLPAGYGAMFLLALVPPLWFSVMNPRVVAATHAPSARR